MRGDCRQPAERLQEWRRRSQETGLDATQRAKINSRPHRQPSAMTYNEDRRRLQERLGYHFRDLDLLATALTHSSAVPDLRAAAEAAGSTAAMIRDNERLEFLGDAVLDLLASEYLVE